MSRSSQSISRADLPCRGFLWCNEFGCILSCVPVCFSPSSDHFSLGSANFSLSLLHPLQTRDWCHYLLLLWWHRGQTNCQSRVWYRTWSYHRKKYGFWQIFDHLVLKPIWHCSLFAEKLYPSFACAHQSPQTCQLAEHHEGTMYQLVR